MYGKVERMRQRRWAKALILTFALLLFSMLAAQRSNALDNGPQGNDGEVDNQKELPPKIEGVIIPRVVHPGIAVELKVMVKSSTPEKLTVWLDKERPYINISCNILKSEFKASEPSKEWIQLVETGSSVVLNSSTKNYDVVFSLVFSWSVEGNKAYSMYCEVKDPFGSRDLVSVDEAYVVERDLIIDGKPRLYLEDGSLLENGDFCRGGAFVRLEGISVHFEGSPDISPSPNVLTMGVKDSTGRVLEYKAWVSTQVNSISFTFPMARSDGPNRIEFVVLSMPPYTNCYGSAFVDVVMDSTSPILGDPWYSYTEGMVHFSWECTETGSGIKAPSVLYSLRKVDGTPISGARSPLTLNNLEGRLALTFEAPAEKDLYVGMDLTDNVDNPLMGERSFLFTTRQKHHHDLAVVNEPVTNPEIPIEGQLLSVRARVENRGTMDEGNVVVEVRINGAHFETLEMGTIPAGSTRDRWWTWTVSDNQVQIEIEVDPRDTIMDEDRSNNMMSFMIYPEYIDLYPDTGYLGISDRDTQPYDVVDLTFKIDCIGTLSTGSFKALFLQDDKFMGLFELEPMDPDRSTYLKVSWKVDPGARNLSLVLDPYNQVFETVEWNNRLDRANPFYVAPKKDGSSGSDTPGPQEVPITQEEGSGNPKHGPSGGTTWEGPEVPDPPGGQWQADIDPIPYSPETPSRSELPPYLIPSVVLTVSFSLLGALLFVSKFEPARYKVAMVLFPLYSKLRKDKVEVGTRFEILGYLKAKPGANYSELKEILDLNDGSLVHHLRVLEREEKIYSKKLGKYKLFYVASYRRQPTVQSYISPLHKRIIEIISHNPGIVPKKLSLILDRSQTDISYHLSELSRNGFLDRKKKGRHIHYYINKELSSMI